MCFSLKKGYRESIDKLVHGPDACAYLASSSDLLATSNYTAENKSLGDIKDGAVNTAEEGNVICQHP